MNSRKVGRAHELDVKRAIEAVDQGKEHAIGGRRPIGPEGVVCRHPSRDAGSRTGDISWLRQTRHEKQENH